MLPWASTLWKPTIQLGQMRPQEAHLLKGRGVGNATVGMEASESALHCNCFSIPLGANMLLGSSLWILLTWLSIPKSWLTQQQAAIQVLLLLEALGKDAKHRMTIYIMEEVEAFYPPPPRTYTASILLCVFFHLVTSHSMPQEAVYSFQGTQINAIRMTCS